MTELPILFTGEMVRAILAGCKSQTRRMNSLDKVNARRDDWSSPVFDPSDGRWVFTAERGPAQQLRIKCPYGVPGDRLWVRETYEAVDDYGDTVTFHFPATFEQQITYGVSKAQKDWFRTLYGKGMRPSIFMPRWASRITLEVTTVRVERLQDITREDCIAEGMMGLDDVHAGWHQSFAQLWNSINGKRASWESNPFVWVISFKRIK